MINWIWGGKKESGLYTVKTLHHHQFYTMTICRVLIPFWLLLITIIGIIILITSCFITSLGLAGFVLFRERPYDGMKSAGAWETPERSLHMAGFFLQQQEIWGKMYNLSKTVSSILYEDSVPLLLVVVWHWANYIKYPTYVSLPDMQWALS